MNGNLWDIIKSASAVAGIITAVFSVIRYGFVPLVKWKSEEAINKYKIERIESDVKDLRRDFEELKDNMK